MAYLQRNLVRKNTESVIPLLFEVNVSLFQVKAKLVVCKLDKNNHVV